MKKSESRWPLLPIDDKLRARLAHGAVLCAQMKRQIDLGEDPQPATAPAGCASLPSPSCIC